MNFEPQGHCIAVHEIFCFSDNRLDGYKITPVFGKQGCLKLGFPDPHMNRYHSPAIRHDSRYGFDVTAMFRWNGDEVKRGGTSPDKNFTAELDDHWYSISKACLHPQAKLADSHPRTHDEGIRKLCQPVFLLSFTGLAARAHLFAALLHIPEASGRHARGFDSKRENPPG